MTIMRTQMMTFMATMMRQMMTLSDSDSDSDDDDDDDDNNNSDAYRTSRLMHGMDYN